MTPSIRPPSGSSSPTPTRSPEAPSKGPASDARFADQLQAQLQAPQVLEAGPSPASKAQPAMPARSTASLVRSSAPR